MTSKWDLQLAGFTTSNKVNIPTFQQSYIATLQHYNLCEMQPYSNPTCWIVNKCDCVKVDFMEIQQVGFTAGWIVA